MSHTLLLEKVCQKIALSAEEQEHLKSAFQVLKRPKNEYLLQPGNPSVCLYFVVSGFVRIFHVDEEGNEITTEIATTSDFISSYEDFINEKPSSSYIQCISDCMVLGISKENYDRLFNEILDWSVFCQSVSEHYLLRSSQRVQSFQKLSAKERYAQLLQSHPTVARNTPVKYLASFLGMRPQSLSRIRKEIK